MNGDVKLTLTDSGRALVYSRLHVVDATGRKLTATMSAPTADAVVIHVRDEDATYPVRIDPTFSDADWVSMNPEFKGASGAVEAMAVDGSGNLFIGGAFNAIRGISASFIAKWNGSAWSALGSGMNNTVFALAVSGSDLYAGGSFTTAGGVPANRIAKWNGSAWSAMG